MTMLKLRSRSTQAARRHRLLGISSPAALLLLRGVSGSDVTATSNNSPVDWAKFATEIGDKSILLSLTTQRSLANNTTTDDIPAPPSNTGNMTNSTLVVVTSTAPPSNVPTPLPTTAVPTPVPTTARPSLRPTQNPTQNPTPIPTKHPSGLIRYTPYGGKKSNLNECEADCDSNSDCKDDLVCYKRRNGGDPLPGCEGTPNQHYNFCVQPQYSPRPTRRPTRAPTMAPTFTPIPGGEPAARVKLYWQEGYYWQDKKYEFTKFCMQCKNSCSVGNKIEITKCSSSNRQKFVRVEGDRTIRPAMASNLCFQRYSVDEDLTLEYCDSGTDQKFEIVGTAWRKNGKFEIQPVKLKSQETCVTNPHHPRIGENIVAQWCTRARRHQTASWTLY